MVTSRSRYLYQPRLELGEELRSGRTHSATVKARTHLDIALITRGVSVSRRGADSYVNELLSRSLLRRLARHRETECYDLVVVLLHPPETFFHAVTFFVTFQ